jgi:hypothetical protein
MPEPTDWLSEISTDLTRLQAQKSTRTGGLEGRVLLNLAFEAGEQYASFANKTLTAPSLKGEQENNKLHLVFNLIAQRGRKLTGRLASIAPTFKGRPDKKDPKAFEQAEIVDRMTAALDQKLDQPSRTWELIDWLRKGGTAFEYVPWIKNATLEPSPQFTDPTPENPQGELLFRDLMQTRLTGQDVILPESQKTALVAQGRPEEMFEVYETVQMVGDVGSEIHGPLSVFVDQTVKSIESLAPDQAVYIAACKTQGWIAEEYGPEMLVGLEGDKDIKIVTSSFTQPDGSSVAGVSLADLVPMLAGSTDKNDPPMNVVVERFQPASSTLPHGRYTCFVPNKKILFDGDNPYDEIPLVDFHWTAVTQSFWTKDYVTDLIAPQRFLNKRLSQLGEFSNSAAYAPYLLGGTVKAGDIPTDYPGAIENALADNGQPLVVRSAPAQMPPQFMPSIDLVIKLLNDMAGGSDLFEENKFFGQMRGPQAIPLMQELLDTEWGPLYLHLGQRMARVKQLRLNRVKQYYPAIRTMHYTDKNQRDEVFEFHTEAILRSGTNFFVTVDRGSVMPEFRALREARVEGRLGSPLSILYIDERTGRIDKSKVAEDLQFGDAGREGREAQYRKLAMELISRLWKGEPVPPVQPFWHHGEMLDELEAAMATTEFLSASQPIQQLFMDRWQQHMNFLQQAADRQQQAAQQQAVQTAVAQATQQAAAQAASDTVSSVMEQMKAQLSAGQQQAPQTQALMQQAVTAKVQ